jgi:hypothetical protein
MLGGNKIELIYKDRDSWRDTPYEEMKGKVDAEAVKNK